MMPGKSPLCSSPESLAAASTTIYHAAAGRYHRMLLDARQVAVQHCSAGCAHASKKPTTFYHSPGRNTANPRCFVRTKEKACKGSSTILT